MTRKRSVKPTQLLQSCAELHLAECTLTLQAETEYETDDEDEDFGQQILKPVFVPKAERDVSLEILSSLC